MLTNTEKKAAECVALNNIMSTFTMSIRWAELSGQTLADWHPDCYPGQPCHNTTVLLYCTTPLYHSAVLLVSYADRTLVGKVSSSLLELQVVCRVNKNFPLRILSS